MDKRRKSSISRLRKSIGTSDCQLAIYSKVEKCLRSSFENACQQMLDSLDVNSQNFRQECLGLIVELARDVSRSTPVPLVERSQNVSQNALMSTKKHLEEYSQGLHKEEVEWKSISEKLKTESVQAQKEYIHKTDVPHMGVNEMNAKYKKQLLKRPNYESIMADCHSDLKDINQHITREVLNCGKNKRYSDSYREDSRTFTRNLHNKLIFDRRDIAKFLD